MNCTEIREQLVEYIEGLLPDEQKQQLEAHLKNCRQCQTELEQLTALGKRLTSDSENKQSDEFENAIFNRIIREQNKRLKQTDGVNRQFNIWRIIMKSKITKFAVAATIVIAAISGISILNRTVPIAFGIEQVIEAYNNIRYLHIKQFRANQQEPAEFWIKSDQQGRVAKSRYYLPVTEDGVKVITWSPEKAEIWFKSKKGYLIFKTKRIEGWMQSLIEQCQPKLVMEKLLDDQKTGIVDINTVKPQNKQEPATIIATYKSKARKEIYYINQATDLITLIEFYDIKNNQNNLVSTTEFYDYNVPIDEKMFTLKDEVPKDIEAVNQLEQLIGIPQGDMTYEQAAAETVRQFFQALIDKDYKKAGQIFCGLSEAKAKEYFGKLNVTAIISIGDPTPYPKCGPHSFKVPCKLEITSPDGQKTIWEPFGPFARCGDDEMHPDRWIIHGGI
ncbi:MAG: zf-HC2 domain-containing protein [Sedimentisphaerales bacterium]